MSHEKQIRAIVGDEHFVAYPDNQANTFALPGHPVIGNEFVKVGKAKNYVRIFDSTPRTVTAKQLREYAKQIGEPFRLDKNYPIVRKD